MRNWAPVHDLRQKYVVRGTIHGAMAAAAIVSVWIVLHGEDFPRFVTAYPETR